MFEEIQEERGTTVLDADEEKYGTTHGKTLECGDDSGVARVRVRVWWAGRRSVCVCVTTHCATHCASGRGSAYQGKGVYGAYNRLWHNTT